MGLSRAGHRPAYARLGEALEALGAPDGARGDRHGADEVDRARSARRSASTRVVLDPTVRDNLRIEDRRGTRGQGRATSPRSRPRGEKIVVYVNSREQSVQLARMLRKRVPELAMRDGVLQRRAVALGASRRRARVPRRRGHGRRGDERVRRGRQHPRHPPRRALPPAVQRRRVQPDVGPGRPRRRAGARPPALRRTDARLNEMILSSLAPERDDLAALYRVLRDSGRDRRRGLRDHQRRARRAVRASADGAVRLERAGGLLGARRLPRPGLRDGRGARRVPAADAAAGARAKGRPDESSVRYAEGLEEIERVRRVQALGARRAGRRVAGSGSTVLSFHTRHLTRRLLNGESALVPATLEQIEAQVRAYNPDADLRGLDEAYEFALEAHEGQMRKSGEPFVNHPLEVALILAELHLDTATLKAALLHDVVEDSRRDARRGPRALRRRGRRARRRRHQARQDRVRVARRGSRAKTCARCSSRWPRTSGSSSSSSPTACTTCARSSALPPRAPARQGASRRWRSTRRSRTGSASRRIKWELEDLAFYYLEPGSSTRSQRMVAESREAREAYLDAGHRPAARRSSAQVGIDGRDLRPAEAPLQHLPEDGAARVRTSTRSTTSSRCGSSSTR